MSLTQKTINNFLNKKRLTFALLAASCLKDSAVSVSLAINSKNARQILHHIETGSTIVPQCPCGTALAWHPDKYCYRTYCSRGCTATYTVKEKKKKNLELLGVEWHSQSADWANKVKNTSLGKFGVDHYSKTNSFKQAVKTTNLKNYGVEHPAQSFEIKEKMIATWQKNHDVTNPMQLSSVRQKVAETTFARLGVHNAFSCLLVQQQIKQTNLVRYSVENPMQCVDIQSKVVATRKKNFYTNDTLDKLHSPSWLFKEHVSGKTIAEIANDISVSSSNLAKYFQKYNIDVIRHRQTYAEKKMLSFFNHYNVKVIPNDRSIISPKELDFFLPEHNLAIEINGVYWHTEQFNKHSRYHLNKTQECAQLGIELWQFWDYEIEQLWELITQKLLSRMQIQQKKTGARKLKVVNVSKEQKSAFFAESHLQGDCGSSINLGLVDQHQTLVMCASFSKSRFSKKHKWELIRLATKKGNIVVGGASKLIARFSKDHMKHNDNLVSYCNRRFSRGNVYQKLGFTCISSKTPGYVYAKGNRIIGSRQQWQKHKLAARLAAFDSRLTEVENMAASSCYRLWDCGQDTWLLTKLD